MHSKVELCPCQCKPSPTNRFIYSAEVQLR